ncbi:MAG TPA: phenylacetate--CoA ligase, partial [Pseudonocardiaceae bacterium]|nr:phenylacetate--CoA ligase [Pseudonocardiaceae bacterium]
RVAVPELFVCCETAEESGEHATALTAELHERLGLRAEVRLSAPGTLPRQETGKAVRVLTWTGGPAPLEGLDDADRR